jgi:hypothetical protein
LRRREFLAAAGGAGAVVVAGCGGGDETERRAREGSDLEIMSFFATFEAIENAFWSEVVERDALATLRGGTTLAIDVERNERRHLEEVEGAVRRLGGEQPQRPRTTFDAVFREGTRAVARAGAVLENLGAAAYLGQANRIQDRVLLAQALAIHTVEGRQAAAVNELAGRGFSGSLPGGPFAEPMTMDAVLARVRRYLVPS